MSAPTNPRWVAVQCLVAVAGGQSLSSALPAASAALSGSDLGLAQELSYGCLRHYYSLRWALRRLLKSGLKARDGDIEALLLIGLYQLRHTRIPDHAAIHASVELTRALGKGWAKGLVNGVLRNAQRQGAALYEDADDTAGEEARHDHPRWLLSALRAAWPGHWPAIVAANNARAPMTLRVNRRLTSAAAYRAQLADAGLASTLCVDSPDGVQLDTPCGVERLPDFASGAVSVQDESAQLAAALLGAQPGERVLDACCAPGGKTAHLLELEPSLQLTAVDASAERLTRVAETLRRLNLNAQLVAGDATAPRDWWDGTCFGRILVDAPCSATGVIRRHPDIKLLRRAEDIPDLARTQVALLAALWPLLKPGGTLLYTTCSVLPAENQHVVEAFVARTPDARPQPLETGWGLPCSLGIQRLPVAGGGDGFYYARLTKAERV